MAATAREDPEAAAASPLLPWDTKVQKFSALYSLYSDGLRGWGYVLNMLCVLTGAATGGVGVGIIRAPAQGEVLGTVTAGLGALHTALQMLRSYLSLESHAKVYMIAVRQLGRLKQEDETAFDSIYAHIPYVPLDKDGHEQAKVPGMTAFLKAGRALLVLGLCQPGTSLSASNAARDPPQP